MKIPLLFLYIFIIISSFSCKKAPWVLPPDRLYFIILENDSPIPVSISENIKLYYLKNGEKIYRPSPTSDDTTFIFSATRYDMDINPLILSSPYVKEFRSDTWFLEYPNGDIDTIQVKDKRVSNKEGKKERCYCENPYVSVKFNGIEATEYFGEKTRDGKIIYKFEK